MELHGTVLSKRVSLEKQHSMSTDSKLASVYVNKREELFILCALGKNGKITGITGSSSGSRGRMIVTSPADYVFSLSLSRFKNQSWFIGMTLQNHSKIVLKLRYRTNNYTTFVSISLYLLVSVPLSLSMYPSIIYRLFISPTRSYLVQYIISSLATTYSRPLSQTFSSFSLPTFFFQKRFAFGKVLFTLLCYLNLLCYFILISFSWSSYSNHFLWPLSSFANLLQSLSLSLHKIQHLLTVYVRYIAANAYRTMKQHMNKIH